MILFLSPIISYGQNVFSNVYVDMNGNTESHSGTNSFDGGYVLSGYHEDDIMILRLDSIGNMIWKRAIENNYDNNIGLITSTKDSCYIVVGNFYDNNKAINYIQAVKFNDYGDTLWAFGYKLNNGKTPSAVSKTSDGGCIITCNHQYTGPSIIKINSDGSLDWAKNYYVGFLDYASDIKQTSDSAYIVCGYSDEKAFLLKIDNQGDTIWSRSYFAENNTWTRAFGLEYLNNRIFTFIITDDNCLIVKMDNMGNVIWAKYLFSYYWYHYPYEGIRIKRDLFENLVFVNPPFAVSMDSIGEVNWSSFFDLWRTDIIPCKDKGGLIIGNGPIHGVDNGIYNQPHIGVYKTDSTGNGEYCLGPTYLYTSMYNINDSILNFFVEEVGTQKNLSPNINDFPLWIDPGCVTFFSNKEELNNRIDIEIYPNPAKEYINVRTNYSNTEECEIIIQDQLGRILNTIPVCHEQTIINIDKYSKGIYFLLLQSKNKIIANQKFIISG